jgi:hypothetical protein
MWQVLNNIKIDNGIGGIFMNWLVHYWRKPIISIKANLSFKEMTPTTNLVIATLLSSFAAIFQSAGGFFPGIGYLISFMSTLPIFLASIISIRHGILSYFLTMLLLLLIQPSELIIFPFTTGLLGVAIGAAFTLFANRILVVSFAGACLFTGIMMILCVFRFPVLGPGVESSFDFGMAAFILAASFLYSWFSVGACEASIRRLSKALPEKLNKTVANE